MKINNAKTKETAKIAVIGGSGIYDLNERSNVKTLKVDTPFGSPSSLIELGDFFGEKIAFLARHGKKHIIPPHLVNYQANIWALAQIGVKRIISVCAVGSLKENYKPGEIVIPDQFIDFTKKRNHSFYNKGRVFHISTADPFCPYLRKLFYQEAKKLKILVKARATYICIEGPRFSTRAESKMFRNFADIIGMTLVPEAQLARELELCYLSLAIITDYDVGLGKEKPVDAQKVLKTMAKSAKNLKNLLKETIPKIKLERDCFCKNALENAAL